MQSKKKFLNALIVSLILLDLLLVVFIANNFAKNENTNNDLRTFGQQKLICPTPAGAGDSLQLYNCYITITPPSLNTHGCEQQPATGYTDIQRDLLTKYKIALQGEQDVGWANEIRLTMCLLAQSSQFIEMLHNTVTVTLIAGGSCEGYTYPEKGIELRGKCDAAVYRDRSVFVHELGHILIIRNPAAYNQFLNTVWPDQIPTWNCKLHFGDQATPVECFADGVSEYLIYKNWRITHDGGQPPGPPTFTEYPTTYASYYNFMKDTIYGGVTY